MQKCIQLFALCLLCLPALQAYSQPDRFILSTGLGAGTSAVHFDLGCTFLFPNQWGGGLYFQANASNDARKKPEDYSHGLCFFEPCDPLDRVNALAFHLVRKFPSAKKPTRLSLEAGPALVSYRYAEFSPVEEPEDPDFFSGLFDENYIVTHDAKQTIGLSMRAGQEFFFGKGFGLELAAYGNLNALESYGGLEVRLLFGKVR